MMNKTERMGGGAQEVLPPGYADAVALNNRFSARERSEVIAKLAELNRQMLEDKKAALMSVAEKMLREGGGKLPSEAPSISDLDNKANFVLAVTEIYGRTEMPPVTDPKQIFNDAMKQQEQWLPKYKDEVIRIAGEFNDRLKAAKESEWKAKTSDAVKSSSGKLTAMDNSVSVEDKQKHIVLAVKKVAQMMREDDLKAQEAARVADREGFRETDDFAA